MKQEIERKFLVIGDGWRKAAGSGYLCRQGYITASSLGATVRVRRLNHRGFLTIKGPTQGISRPEMEYEIPIAEADYMMETLCNHRLISKRRYRVHHQGLCWEIDEFLEDNAGLIVAEIELKSEDQPFEKPDWLGAEVSYDLRYSNAALARNPFKTW